MNLDPALLAILACPDCRSALRGRGLERITLTFPH